MNINRKLKETATWWAITPDGYGGETFAAPVKIACKWENALELKAGKEATKEIISRAAVYTDRDVSVGDYLCQGDQTAHNDPTVIAGPFKITVFDRITDLRGVQTLRRAIL